ncbi:MAG: hypothetical protein EBX36_03590, partial [Planctomycetia bacterium]|nr:hypothetical protein [Planctomycetia bacterium]
VARGSRLEVAFDTARVAAYRIVGHRQTAADALAAGGPPGLDLHAGEAARVVYEVMRRPRPAPGRGDLVSAMLEWEPAAADAAGGTAAGRVRRGLPEAIPPGLPDAAGCELVLAVALGELAAASVHAEPWRRFADGAAAVVSRWRARGDVTPTGQSLIHCLESDGIPSTAGGR